MAFWDSQFRERSAEIKLSSSLPNYLDHGIRFFGSVDGKHALDIGCGLGENVIALARMGARVTAIDTSPIAIDKINRFVEQTQLQLQIEASVHNAMDIGSLGRFDFVTGAMISTTSSRSTSFATCFTRL